MAVEFYIHKMSEHMETAQILHWLVREGDRVEMFQPIVEVMTDKVTAEVESPATGIIKGIRPGAVDGAEVPVGEPICYIADPDESVPTLSPLPGYEPVRPSSSSETAPGSHPKTGGSLAQEDAVGVRASPVARRVAKELHVTLEEVRGTGPQGRITEADVRHYAAGPIAGAGAPEPESVVLPVPPIVSSAGEWLDLTSIQRATGERLRESVVNAPQFALNVAADMTQLLWLRDQLVHRVEAAVGSRPTITGLLIMVVADALTRHPRANAEFVAGQGGSGGGRLKVHPDINLGIAVGAEEGLVVPVIHNADCKSLAEITRELAVYQAQAKSLRFQANDLSDGTFTLSNLGMYGVDEFRAIINPPQSAILATGRIVKTPVGLPDDTIALRPMMQLTLTVDHRCMDGVQAARFLAEVKQLIEQPHLLLA